jgi:hypothetical protein
MFMIVVGFTDPDDSLSARNLDKTHKTDRGHNFFKFDCPRRTHFQCPRAADDSPAIVG